MVEELPPELSERLGFYVYLIVDPRTEAPFYVGKGKGGRATVHEWEAILTAPEAGEPEKRATIRAIRAAGLEPRIDIVKHGLEQDQAFMVEAALIDCLPNLTNRVRGMGTETGRVVLSEFIAQHAAEPLGPTTVPALFIRLGSWHAGGFDGTAGGYRPGITAAEIYNATRGWWKVAPWRLRRDGITHAVAAHRGVTRAVFAIRDWTRNDAYRRWAFEGDRIESGPVFDHYVGAFGKRVPFTEGSRNPVSYYVPLRESATEPEDRREVS